MRKSKLPYLTLALLLVSSSVLPSITAAAVTAGAEPLKKSHINESIIMKNAVKILPKQKKSESLLAKKFKSKFNKTAPNQNTYLTDELIVKYKNNTKQTTLKSLSEKFSLKPKKQLHSINAEVVKIPKGATVADYTNKLKKDPSVESVQPNYKYHTTDINNAPNFYSQLWGLNNTGQTVMGTPGMKNIDVDAPEARTNLNGQLNEVLVGVLDTGIDIHHPDLQNSIWTNKREIPNNGKDDDGNGYVDDVHGWDFYNKDNSVYDQMDGDQHGTHVAGIISGSSEGTSFDTNRGIAGVAPNVKIVPIKFMGPDGSGTTADAIAGIEYAQKLGIKILNASWGGNLYDQLLEEAIKNYNGLFVVAAGNESADNDTVNTYPADFNCSNILSVAALDNTGNLASFSNYGVNSVDIAAPGVNILSSVPKFPADETAASLGLQQLGAAAQVSSSQLKYKAVFDGIGYEKYTGTDRTDAFTKAMNYLDIPKDTTKKVLLVQDDEHDLTAALGAVIPEMGNYFADYLSVYQALLKGYNYHTVTISSSKSIKDSGIDLSSYNAVIWFTGHGIGLGSIDLNNLSDNNAALTKDDISALTNYLNAGGHLLLTGQDALSGNESSPFVKDLLHLNVVPNIAPVLNVEGLSGGIYNGNKYSVNRYDTVYPYNVSDAISANNPDTIVNLKYVSDYSQAYEYLSGTSMATPFVTGSAALLLGLYPNMSPEILKLYLTSKGKALPQLNGVIKNSKIVKDSKLNSFSDNTLPGVPLLKNRNNGYVSADSDKNDIFALSLKEGETVNLSLNGRTGNDFDLYVYDQSAKDVNGANGMDGYSENPGTPNENIIFKAPKDGVYYVDVYAYKGAGSYQLNVGNFGGTYENDSKLLSYVGPWNTTSTAQLSNGTASGLNSTGEMDFTFTGYSFDWQGYKDPTQGVADVYIDGIKENSPSLFAASYQTKQSIFKKTYSYYGQHYVRIVWTGQSNPSAKKSAAGINIDRLVVKSIPNSVNVSYDSTQKHPIVSWNASSWAASYNIYRKDASQADFKQLNSTSVTNLSYTDTTAIPGKTYIYAISLFTKDNQETGLSSPYTFIFDDDSNGSISINSTTVKGNLNAAVKDIDDVWSKKLEQGRTYEFGLTGPAASNFDLNIFNIGTSTIYGTKPYQAAEASGSTEQIIFKPEKTGIYYLVPHAKSGSGGYNLSLSVQSIKRIENTDSNIKYSGKWTKVKTTRSTGGSVSQTSKASNYLKYSFTGTGIKLFAIKDKTMGKADIYLDGKKVKTVDFYSSKLLFRQIIFENQNLANQEHSIKIVATGKKRSSSTGTIINIDSLDFTHFVPFK